MIEEKIMSLDEMKKEIVCGCDIIGYVEAGKNFINNRILSDKDIRNISYIESNLVLINFRNRFNVDYIRYPNGTTYRVNLIGQKQKELTFNMWLHMGKKSRLPELTELMSKWILIAKLVGKINNTNVKCEIKRFMHTSNLDNMGYGKNIKHHVFEYDRMKNRTDMKLLIKEVKYALGLRYGDTECIFKLWEKYNADKLLVGDMKIYTDAYAAFYRTHTWITRPSLYTQDIIAKSAVYDDFVTYLYDMYRCDKHPEESKWIKYSRGVKNTISYKIKYNEFMERIVVDYINTVKLQGEVEEEPIDVIVDFDNLLANYLDKLKRESARIVVENNKAKVVDYTSSISFKKFTSTILEKVARDYYIGYTAK